MCDEWLNSAAITQHSKSISSSLRGITALKKIDQGIYRSFIPKLGQGLRRQVDETVDLQAANERFERVGVRMVDQLLDSELLLPHCAPVQLNPRPSAHRRL